jgi:hypothetical protein
MFEIKLEKCLLSKTEFFTWFFFALLAIQTIIETKLNKHEGILDNLVFVCELS